jgi:subtilisin family serine protease
MRRASSLLLSLAALGAAAAPAPAAPPDAPPFAPGRVIVRFTSGTGVDDRASARQAVDATSSQPLALARAELVRLPAGRPVAAALRALRARDDVEFAQPDLSYALEGIPNDSLFSQQWGLRNTGQTIDGSPGTPDADIDAPEAWDLTTGSDSLVVGVIDSGVNAGHPDLQANVDTAGAFDFVNSNANVSDDTSNHGTLVASVLGGRGANGIGTTGVMQRVRILPLQVLNPDGSLSSSAIVNAVGYARDKGARVVNMSFGHFGGTDDPALTAAIEAAPNILFSTSAGNLNASDLPNDNDVDPHWPSNLTVDHANVIASANTTNTDALGADSSYGGTSVDLAAPGTDIAGAKAAQVALTQEFDGVSAGSLPSGWTGTWTTTAAASPSPPTPLNSLTDSPSGNYSNNTNTVATSPSFTVSSALTCTVSHRRYRRTELGHDYLHVEVSRNGGTFNDIEPAVSGNSPGTGYESVAPTFAASAGDSVRLQFRLATDASTTADGVRVDNVRIACTPLADGYVFGSGTSFSSPMTAGAAALLLARNPSLTPAQLKAALRATVDPVPGLDVSTGGRLNLNTAIRSVPAPPAVAASQPAPPAVTLPVTAPRDTRAPRISGLLVTPSVFLPLRAGATISRTRRGASLRFRVDERSSVRVRVRARRAGRRSGRRCVKPTRANRRARACFRYVVVGTAAVSGKVTGRVTRRFSGRVRRRALKAGAYRLEVTAIDAALNSSRPATASFRIARR